MGGPKRPHAARVNVHRCVGSVGVMHGYSYLTMLYKGCGGSGPFLPFTRCSACGGVGCEADCCAGFQIACCYAARMKGG